MRWSVVALLAIGLASSARANDWEKFYRPLSFASSLIPTDSDPEITSSSGNSDRDIEEMWRKGFAPVGFSSFNSPNSKTADAVRLGKKLKVRYVMIGTKLESSHAASMPLTVPTTTTSVSNGNAAIYSSRGDMRREPIPGPPLHTVRRLHTSPSRSTDLIRWRSISERCQKLA